MKFSEAVDFLNRLQKEQHLRLIFIPMTENDRQLMIPLAEKLEERSGNILVEHTDPEDIQNIVGECSLLISGRLQLTLMGLNALVPGIGVANSSKIANCLNMFGLPVFNNQSTIDFEQLYAECCRWLADPDFRSRAETVRSRMLKRMEQSEKSLRELLTESIDAL